MHTNLELYLEESEAINFKNTSVYTRAKELTDRSGRVIVTAKKCYEFVRDEIYHCCDYDMNPVTYSASDVLLSKTGFCYAKNHLLVALLRANDIPAGLCYQRITSDMPGSGFCIHGLAATYIPYYGWYMIDPRGNKEGINAQFNPPAECFAFSNSKPGEYLFPEIWHEPLYIVKKFLTSFTDYREALKYLPDIEVCNIPYKAE